MKNDFIAQLQTVVNQIKRAKDELADLKKIQAAGTKSSKSVLEKARDDAKALVAEILRLGKLEKNILQKIEKSTTGKNPEISRIIKDNLESGQKIMNQAMSGLSKDVGKLRGSYVGETIFFFHKQIQWYLSKAVSLTLLEIPQVAIQSVSDFNKGITELAVLTRALPQSLSKTRDVILQITDSTIYGIKDITSTMKFLAQAGFEIKDINNSMGAIANLATATSSSLQDAASSISTVVVALGMSTSESSKVADILAQATNLSRLSVEDLSTSFNYTAATAGQLGIPIGKLTAQLALLSNSGIKASTASTGWRQVMETLLAPSEKARLIFSKYGITLDSINPRIVEMTDILKNLSKISAPDLSAVFSTRGGNIITSLLNQGADALAMMEKAINKQGIAAQMAAEQMLTLENTWKNLKNSFSSLLALGGETGSNPKLIDFLTGLSETVKSFRKENLEVIQNTMSSLVKISATLIPMAVGGKVASLGFNKLLNSFGAISAFMSGGLERHFLTLAQSATELGKKANAVKFNKLAAEVGGLSKSFSSTSNIIGKMGIALKGLAATMGPVGIAATVLSSIIGVFLLVSKRKAETIGKLKNDLVRYQSEVSKTREEYVKFNMESAALVNQIKNTSDAVNKSILESQQQDILKKQQEASINLLKKLTSSNLQILKEAAKNIRGIDVNKIEDFEAAIKVILDTKSLDTVIGKIGEELLNTNFNIKFNTYVSDYDEYKGGFLSTDGNEIINRVKDLKKSKIDALKDAKTTDQIAAIEKSFNDDLKTAQDNYIKLNTKGYSESELKYIREFFTKVFSYATSSFEDAANKEKDRVSKIEKNTKNILDSSIEIPKQGTVMSSANLLKTIDDLAKRKKYLEEFIDNNKGSNNDKQAVKEAEQSIKIIDEFFNNVLTKNITSEGTEKTLADFQIKNRDKALSDLKSYKEELKKYQIDVGKLGSYSAEQLKVIINKVDDTSIKNLLQQVYEGTAASIDKATKESKEFGKAQAKLVSNLDVVTYFDKINTLAKEKPFHTIVKDLGNDTNKLQAFADSLGISVEKLNELSDISGNLNNKFDLSTYKKVVEFTKSKKSSDIINIIETSEAVKDNNNSNQADFTAFLENELNKSAVNFTTKKSPQETLKENFLKAAQLDDFGITETDLDKLEGIIDKEVNGASGAKKVVLEEYLKWLKYTKDEINKLNSTSLASKGLLDAQIKSAEELNSNGKVSLKTRLDEVNASFELEKANLKGADNEKEKLKLLEAQTEEKRRQIKVEEYQLEVQKKFKDMWADLKPDSLKRKGLSDLEMLLQNAGSEKFSLDKNFLIDITRRLKSQGVNASGIINQVISKTKGNETAAENLKEAEAVAKEGANGSSFFHGALSGYDKFKSKVEEGADTLTNIAKMSSDVLNNITDGITDSMALAITEGQSLEKSLKSVFSNILKMITQALLKMMIMKTIEAGMKSFGIGTEKTNDKGGTTVTSTDTSSALEGKKHTGGIVGNSGMLKTVNPAVFNNAPRYHTGGLVQGEVPIIAKKGEYVLTPDQMKAVSSNTPSINFNIVNQSQQPVSVKSSNISLNDQKEYIINVLLEDLDNRGSVSQALDRRGR